MLIYFIRIANMCMSEALRRLLPPAASSVIATATAAGAIKCPGRQTDSTATSSNTTHSTYHPHTKPNTLTEVIATI